MIFNPAVIRKSGPSAAASPKDVNFYDYDGTLLYSYTLPEARALASLPKGPFHEGLVFQRWNCTLEKMKALARPENFGPLYITDDGKTRLNICISSKFVSDVSLYFRQTVSNGVRIDWGDGSPEETIEGSWNVNISHQYMSSGNYVIALFVKDGCTMRFGHGSQTICIMGNTGANHRAHCNVLREVHIGDNVDSIFYYSFSNCASLTCITIPGNVKSIENSAFSGCGSLLAAIIPDTVTSIGPNTFAGCDSLDIVTVPDGITTIRVGMLIGCQRLVNATIPDAVATIEDSGIRNCYSLVAVTIPDTVTSIGPNAFSCNYCMREYHFKPSSPPVLEHVNAFEGIPADCIIYVPPGSLEAYRTAENWSVYADHMREEGA